MAFPLNDLRFLVRVSMVLLAAASAACERSSRRPVGHTVRDSAGIRIRRSHRVRTVTPEDIQTAVASRLEGIADKGRRAFMKAYYDKLPVAKTLPAFAAIKSDVAGNLWVLDYPVTGDETRIWTVFDPMGVWLGDVRTPAGFRLIEVGEDYALGRSRDEMNVEYIQVYGLIRP